MKCPYCGKVFQDAAKYCPYCGEAYNAKVKKKCTQCGQEIKDSSLLYCPNCGSRINKDHQYIESTQNSNPAKNIGEGYVRKKYDGGKAIRFFGYLILVLIILVAIFFALRSCIINNDGKLPTRRNAQTSDIDIDFTYDFPISVKFTVVTKVKINNLVINFSFKDSKGNILTTKVEEIGNISKGGFYTGSFSATDFELGVLLKVNYVSYQVTEGTIPIF